MKSLLIIAAVISFLLPLSFYAQSLQPATNGISVVIVSDQTGSLDVPSLYEGITRRSVLTHLLPRIVNTLRDKENVHLFVFRLCRTVSLAIDCDISQTNMDEIKKSIPCEDPDATNIANASEAVSQVLETRPQNRVIMVFLTDGIQQFRGTTQEDAFKAIKMLGKQLKGRAIVFAMMGVDDSVRLKWRNVGMSAFNSNTVVLISGFSDVLSNMQELLRALE